MIRTTQLDPVMAALKALHAETKRYQAHSTKARTMGPPKAMQRAAEAMHQSAAEVQRLQRAAWAAILDADLPISLGEQVINPNGWHRQAMPALAAARGEQ